MRKAPTFSFVIEGQSDTLTAYLEREKISVRRKKRGKPQMTIEFVERKILEVRNAIKLAQIAGLKISVSLSNCSFVLVMNDEDLAFVMQDRIAGSFLRYVQTVYSARRSGQAADAAAISQATAVRPATAYRTAAAHRYY